MKPRDLITEAREQAQRRSLSLATRDLLNGLCDALEKAQAEIERALRDAPSYNGMAGTTTTVEDIAADRLEIQEQAIAALTARAEKAEKNCDIWEKKWWEEALEKVEAQTYKEKAERERDAAVAVIGIQAKQLKESHVVLCNICKFEDMIGCVHKNHCDGYQLFKWRGLPQEGEGK